MEMFHKKGGIKLLKEYLYAGVFGYACCQFLLTGKSNRALELLREGVKLKVRKKLTKKYLPTLKKFDISYQHIEAGISHEHSNKVWVSWMQGMDKAPALVQRCYRSLQENLRDREIIVITDENVEEYVSFPKHIIEKYKRGIITRTHFSDLLRIELLCKYGGTWIDSTVFCSGSNIPSYMLDSELFMFQKLKPGADGSVQRISSWFMTAHSNNKILLAVKDLLYEYWKTHSDLIDYFLIHHFVGIVSEYYKEDWNKMVQYPNSMPHILLLMLFEPFNQEKWDAVTSVCPFHKLAYKRSEEEMAKEGTYYKYIMNHQL